MTWFLRMLMIFTKCTLNRVKNHPYSQFSDGFFMIIYGKIFTLFGECLIEECLNSDNNMKPLKYFNLINFCFLSSLYTSGSIWWLSWSNELYDGRSTNDAPSTRRSCFPSRLSLSTRRILSSSFVIKGSKLRWVFN